MKIVNNPKKMRLSFLNKKPKPKKSVTEDIERAMNKMINPDTAKGKTGGYNFGNYNLDLMKLK